MKRLFIESSIFSRTLKQFIRENRIAESDYKNLQEQLLHDPKAGAVIPGLLGLRKIRMGYRGKGTSGGLRIVYLDIPEAECLHFLLLYPKNAKEDLSPEEKREIRILVKTLKKEATRHV